MERRALLRLLVVSGAVRPSTSLGKQSLLPVIGFFRSTGRKAFEDIVSAFEAGLKDAGITDGTNVRIEYRWANNDLSRLPVLARDLIDLHTAVIVGNSLAIDALRAITDSQPMIFVVADDPVKAGYVENLGHPGGNLTGVTFFGGSRLNAKRLEFLNEIVPGSSTIALLNDADYPDGAIGLEQAQNVARMFGRSLEMVQVSGEATLDGAFARITALKVGALLVNGSPLFTSRRHRIVELVAKMGVPAIYDQRAYVEAGGLMSYGASFTEAYRQAGHYAARVLSGERPGDLPVLQPTVFNLAVNARTARTLGLSLPPSITLSADDVVD